MKHQNMAMLVDFYEFTMSNGYFKSGFFERNVYFDVFFRSVPDKGGFAIAAGLEQLIEYINSASRAISTPFPRERPFSPTSRSSRSRRPRSRHS